MEQPHPVLKFVIGKVLDTNRVLGVERYRVAHKDGTKAASDEFQVGEPITIRLKGVIYDAIFVSEFDNRLKCCEESK